MAALTPAEIANAPTITLGGRQFHIPRLAIKQNRVVVAGLKTLLPMIGQLEKVANEAKAVLEANKTAIDAGTPTGLGDEAALAMIQSFPMDGVTFDTICDVVYAAITRGDPTFTRAEFDELPTGVDELLMAIPLVMGQSFAFARKDPAPPGEGRPEAAPAAAPATTT